MNYNELLNELTKLDKLCETPERNYTKSKLKQYTQLYALDEFGWTRYFYMVQ